MSKLGRWTTWIDGLQKVGIAIRRLTFEENYHKDYIDVEDPANNAVIAFNANYTPAPGRWEDKQLYELKVFTTITGDYTALLTDEVILVNNGSTAVTVTLPTAVGNEGKTYNIKLLGTAPLTIDGNGTETIDGDTTLVVVVQYDAPMITSDSSNWVII